MFLTSYKETKDIISKNLLKITIAGVLTFFMGAMGLTILLPIIGYWILKLDKFNLKTVIIIGLFYLILLIGDEVYFSKNKVEDYIEITKIVLPIALIIDWFIKREIAPNIIIFIYFIVFYFKFNSLEFAHQKQDLCSYSLIILDYFLFFAIQEKKLKECLSIKGILAIVGTFIVFFSINFLENEYLFKISIKWDNIIWFIIAPCIAYYLEVFYYIFVFNLIKNLKRNSNQIKGEKDDFSIE